MTGSAALATVFAETSRCPASRAMVQAVRPLAGESRLHASSVPQGWSTATATGDYAGV